MLPEDLHGLAAQAAFPDIVARGCLSLDVALVGTAAATAALSAFPSLLQAAQQTAKLIQISAMRLTDDTRPRGDMHIPVGLCSPVEADIELLKKALCFALTSQPEAVDLTGLALSCEITDEVLACLAPVSVMKSLAIWVPGSYCDGSLYSDYFNCESTIDPLLKNLAKFTGLHSLCLDCTPAGYERYDERRLDPVSHLTSLTKLVVRGGQKGDDCICGFARALCGLQSIKELEMSLSENEKCAESLVAVCAHMSGLSSLTLVHHPDMYACERGAGVIGVDVAGRLGRLTGLRTLDLSQCPVQDHSGRTAHACALAASLERLPELRMLKLPELKAMSESNAAVVHALSGSHSITCLALQLPDRFIRFGAHPPQEDLWAKVCALSTLQDLTVEGPYAVFRMQRSASGETATNSALENLSCLTRLCVSGDFSEYQLSGVNSLTCLCTLSVQCSGLCDGDIQELVCSLAHLPALTDVTLECDWPARVEDAELQACFGALASVTHLDVSGWQSRSDRQRRFPAARLSAPKSALRAGVVSGVGALTQLRALSIGHRVIDRDTAVALRGALPALQLLKQFSMANCKCGKELGEIMNGLRTVTGLQELDLSFTDLSCAAAEISAALRQFSALQILNFRYGMLTAPRDLAAVLDALHEMSALLKVDMSANKCRERYQSFDVLGKPLPAYYVSRTEPKHIIRAMIDLVTRVDSLRCVLVDDDDIGSSYSVEFRQLEDCLEVARKNDSFRLEQVQSVCDDAEYRDQADY